MPYLREVSAVWFKKELRNPEFEKSGRYQENSVFISVSDVLLVKDNPIKNKKNQYR